MKKAVVIVRICAAVLCVISMILIFNFSADNADESGQKSAEVTEKIVQTVDPSIVEKPIEEQQKVYETVGSYVRKAAHFLEFAALGLFVSIIVNTIYPDFLRRFFMSLGACALYAVTDEIHQIFVPGRACEIADLLIDLLGVSVGILLSMAIFAIFKQILSKKAQK